MKYVTVKAPKYQEALKKLRTEYGDDAIPIDHKYVKEGGLLNSKLFGKEIVELTAGIPDKKMGLKSSIMPKKMDYLVGNSTEEILNSVKKSSMTDPSPRIKPSIMDETKNFTGRDYYDPQKEFFLQNNNFSQEVKNTNPNINVSALEKEFSELKESLNRLLDEQNKTSEKKPKRFSENTTMRKYYELLRCNDYNEEESEMIMHEIKNTVGREDSEDEHKIEKTLKELLQSKIVTSDPIKTTGKKKIIMFIGTTGVGKTTTIAKLGALHSLREGKKVVFITIDNYRIAATEQLKKYAEIMKIPIFSVNDQKEFKAIVEKEKADMILVDTSGRSHRNQMKIAEMKTFADTVDYEFEKILCVSANTKKNDLNDVFKSFDVLNFDSVIITKVDETTYIGNVIDIAEKYHKPISYYTTGQEVPNDIEVAKSSKLVDLMIPWVKKSL